MPDYPTQRAWRCAVYLLLAAGVVLAMVLSAAAQTTPQETPDTASASSSVSDVVTQFLAPDIKVIVDRGELIVAMTKTDQPPFYYVGPDGRLAGLDAMLARDIASRLGVKVRFNRSPESFNKVAELVAQGGADIAISKLSRTLPRAQIVRFTQPYVTFRHAMLLNRLKLAQHISEEALPQLLRRLEGKVGVIGQSSYEVFLGRYFPRATAVSFKTWDEAVKAVFAGEVLAVYRDELEIQKINQSRKDASLTLKTVIYKDMHDDIAMAVAWNRPHLVAWLDIYLDAFPTHQTAADILQTYGPTKE